MTIVHHMGFCSVVAKKVPFVKQLKPIILDTIIVLIKYFFGNGIPTVIIVLKQNVQIPIY
jgi:hypothetical protein